MHRRTKKPEKAEKDSQLVLSLRDEPGDERQGSTAAQGFAYQQWWAALVSVEMLEQPDDFAVGLEIKQDVVILDSATSPKTIEFCQIKKNETAGAWLLKALHQPGRKKKDGTRDESVLAKLYRRRHEFSGHPTRLRFVSNVGFKVPAASGPLVNVTDGALSHLTTSQQDVVKKAIGGELGITQQVVDLAEVRLHRSNLPLAEPEVFVGGKISKLCETNCIPFPLSKPTLAAIVLVSEIQSRATNTNFAKSFEDLKGRILTRSEAIKALARVSKTEKNKLDVLRDAVDRLNSESYDFLVVEQIEEEQVSVCAAAADKTNQVFWNLARALQSQKAAAIESAGSPAKLGDLMEAIAKMARTAAPETCAGSSAPYINAVALLVLKNGLDIPPVATDPKSEAEK